MLFCVFFSLRSVAKTLFQWHFSLGHYFIQLKLSQEALQVRCGSFQIPQYQLVGKGFLCVSCHWAAAIISTIRTSAVSYFNSSYYKLVSYCCSSQRSEDCQQGIRETTGPVFVKGCNEEEAFGSKSKGGHTEHLIFSLIL